MAELKNGLEGGGDAPGSPGGASAAGGHQVPAALSVSVGEEGASAQVVTVAGELDISNIAILERALDSALADRPERLVFDLSELGFMDSSGIALLLKARDGAGEVEVRRPSQILLRIFQSMGLMEVLRVTP